jgi:ABC-type Fe3+ transport system permease subunit
MKANALTDALYSLKERYRKNLESRVVRIFLWVQLAFIVGMVCGYLAIQASVTYAINQIQSHPPPPAQSSVEMLPDFWTISCWSLIIGLPIVALILGIQGILPGTRKKNHQI